jgi:hypothetical protein
LALRAEEDGVAERGALSLIIKTIGLAAPGAQWLNYAFGAYALIKGAVTAGTHCKSANSDCIIAALDVVAAGYSAAYTYASDYYGSAGSKVRDLSSPIFGSTNTTIGGVPVQAYFHIPAVNGTRSLWQAARAQNLTTGWTHLMSVVDPVSGYQQHLHYREDEGFKHLLAGNPDVDFGDGSSSGKVRRSNGVVAEMVWYTESQKTFDYIQEIGSTNWGANQAVWMENNSAQVSCCSWGVVDTQGNSEFESSSDAVCSLGWNNQQYSWPSGQPGNWATECGYN